MSIKKQYVKGAMGQVNAQLVKGLARCYALNVMEKVGSWMKIITIDPVESVVVMEIMVVLNTFFFSKVKKGQIQLGRGLVRCTSCIGTGVCSRCGGEGLIFEDL
jgi:hypothetical protein